MCVCARVCVSLLHSPTLNYARESSSEPSVSELQVGKTHNCSQTYDPRCHKSVTKACGMSHGFPSEAAHSPGSKYRHSSGITLISAVLRHTLPSPASSKNESTVLWYNRLTGLTGYYTFLSFSMFECLVQHSSLKQSVMFKKYIYIFKSFQKTSELCLTRCEQSELSDKKKKQDEDEG